MTEPYSPPDPPALIERLRTQEREDWRGYRPPANALCGEAADALVEAAALLREASAALPALTEQVEAENADFHRQRVRAERAEALVAALRAQLADATTITDEMVAVGARAYYESIKYDEELGWEQPGWGTEEEREVYRNVARTVLAAALSVPAVPVDEEAL